ncbi:MAG: phospholipid carrier-dependent glycosyltransferase [Rhizobiales bacterium]|nr:phospholipid carrier-dependent glycosyltransferase [Hyphomicrobiales bacterium]
MLATMEQGYRPYLLLTLMCLTLFLPGLSGLPPLDRDESRFAQATKQMMETGDYIVPYFQETPRSKKPIGIYWLQAASVEILSSPAAKQIWAYRLPSFFGGLAAVLLTFALGARLFDRRTALVSAAVIATSLLLIVESHLAQVDSVLLATIVLTMYGLALATTDAAPGAPRAEEKWHGYLPSVCFWGGLGLSIMVKGPVGPAVVAMAAIVISILDRDGKWLLKTKPLLGVPLLIAIVAPWPIALYASGAGDFIAKSASEDLLPKLLSGQESHGAPPGTYLLAVYAAFWPMSLLVIPAFVVAWRDRHDRAIRFCLAWAVPAWIMFELVPTKLPHYVLPAYPALALLAGIFVTRGIRRMGLWSTVLFRIHIIFWALLTLVIAGGAIYGADTFGSSTALHYVALVLAAVTIAGGGLAVSYMWRRDAEQTAMALAALMLLFVPLLTMHIGPHLNRIWLSREIAEALPPEQMRAPLASVGYNEPSLIFMVGTDTRLTSPQAAARQLVDTPQSFALISDEYLADFEDATKALDITPLEIRRIEGQNYSNGKNVVLHLFAAPGNQP